MLHRLIVFYLFFTGAGAAIGFGSWYFQFHESKAIKVVAFDRVDLPGVPTQYVIEPLILMEIIKSRSFAKRVAERAGIADLASLLPAATNGGQQKLSVRTLAGNPPIAMELRLSMPSVELVQAAMTAVGDEIASIQSVKTEAFLKALERPTPQAQLSASESRLAIGNEQAMLAQLALNEALIETSIKVKSGQTAETSVLPPSGPRLLIAAGAIGMFCFAVLLRNFGGLFISMLVGPVRRAPDAETEAVAHTIQPPRAAA